jgi:pilus assembly protein FimV
MRSFSEEDDRPAEVFSTTRWPFLMASRVPAWLLIIAALLLPLAAPEASAVILGEIRSSSRLGQILHAEIDVDEHPAERFNPACLKLYQPESVSDDFPWITAARLDYQRERGKGRLNIVSAAPVHDPVIQLGVRSTCADGASRRYTLLLSPPSGEASAQAPRTTAVAGSVQRPADAPPAAERGRTTAPAAARSQPPAAKRPEPETSGSVGSEKAASLRLSEQLAALGQSSVLGRELLRLEHRTLEMLNEANDDPQALSEKLAWLEANVAELKRAEERLEGVATALPSTPPAPGGDSALATAKAPTIPLAPASSHRAADVPTTSPAAAAQTGGLAAPPDLRQQLAAAAADSDPWLLFAGLAPVAVLVLLLVLRRQGLAVEARARGPAAFPVSGPGSPESLRTEPTTTGAIKPRGQATEPTLSAAPAPVAQPTALPAPAPLPAHTGPEIAGAAPALELAEIMLSFGRVTGAARTLEEYVAALPQESLRPWIRLLQIYERNGMRKEFEALTLKLNRNFNVEVIRWSGGEPSEELELLPVEGVPGKAVTLEEIPRIRDQIISLWGRPECSDYIEKLLRDNRDGLRSGFTLPIVEELLFLIDLSGAREATREFPQ